MHSEKEKDHTYLKKIQELVDEVQYGAVTVVIQDGKVIQIEKNEKYRIKN